MNFKTLDVSIPEKNYPVHIGYDISKFNLWDKYIQGHQVLIVTQENIASYYLSLLTHALQKYQCDVIFLPQGEEYKNLLEWEKIIQALIEKFHEKSTTLISLGGGMIGDMTGFAAYCYQRGVAYINIPTSLIAQVDAAIGGKTGLNHISGKNMLGGFHQPKCVVTDVKMLLSLSEREFRSGLFEVIKYALIQCPLFFDWIEKNISLLLTKDIEALLYIVTRSTEIKAHIVSQDEKDNGKRRLLNFGHTFAHAIESAFAYKKILHGEAVGWGMLMAAKLSLLLNKISQLEFDRIFQLVAPLVPEVNFSSINLFTHLKHDKKILNKKLHFIVLNNVGDAEVVTDLEEDMIEHAMQFILDRSPLSRG